MSRLLLPAAALGLMAVLGAPAQAAEPPCPPAAKIAEAPCTTVVPPCQPAERPCQG
ncbi:hypothetical protein NZK33_05345 [Cyanobium sp. FGCU-6]|nr:hypothetical protein [Cyanobium sp. FGCU6]